MHLTGRAIAVACSVWVLAALAAAATAGIREATLEVAPTTVVGRPALRFAIADPSAERVRVARLSFRRPEGVSVRLPEGALLGVVRFRDPGGAARRVDLRRGRRQRGRVDRYVLADAAGAQVVARATGPFFLTVRPPEGSTDVVVTLTAGSTGRAGLLRPSGCRTLRFVVRLSPVAAGLTGDRSASLPASAQRTARICR